MNNDELLQLNLSTRTYNALYAVGITTIQEFKFLKRNDLNKIKNLGKKSIDEILNKIEQLSTEIKNSETSPNYKEDYSRKTIEELNLSNRVYHALSLVGIKTVEDFLQLETSELSKIKNLGEKSIKEIFDKINYLKSNKADRIKAESFFRNSNKNILEFFFGDNASIDYIAIKNKDGIFVNNLLLEELNFSTRLFNILENLECNDLKKILYLNVDDFLDAKNLGTKTKNELFYFFEHDVKYIIHTVSKNNNLPTIKKVVCNLYEKYNNILKKYNVINSSQQLILLLSEKNPNLSDEKSTLKAAVESKIFYSFLGELVVAFINLKKLTTENEIKDFCFNNNFDISYKNILNYLIENELVDKKYGFYIPKKSSFKNYLQTIKNDKWKNIAILRAEGKSLEEIGIKYNVSRQRIQQIETKVFKNAVNLLEDFYSPIISEYSWTREALKYIFDIDNYSVYYLLYKYAKGKKDIDCIIDNLKIPIWYRKRAEKYKYRNCININGFMVPYRRYDIFIHAIRTFAKDAITEETFELKYLELIQSYNLPIEFQYPRNRIHNVSNLDIVIGSFGRTFRYLDTKLFDFQGFLKKINFAKYNNKEISTELIIKNYPELMEEYDIRNEYELHNLLKKRKDEIPFEIEFLRMPNLILGKANREQQVLELLKQESPIGLDDFVQRYHEDYGVKKQTIIANYLSSIISYLDNGVFSINVEKFTLDEINYLKSKLINDIYAVSEIREIFAQKFTAKNIEKINVFNMHTLGFNIRGSVVYKDTCLSLDSFIKNYIDSNMIIDFSGDKRDLLKNQTCHNIIHDRLKSLDLIEFESYKYLNFNCLKNNDISKYDLLNFITDAKKYIRGKFFTIRKLINSGFEHKLFDLGFNDIFYQSIICSDNKLKRIRADNKIIFKQTEINVTLTDFIYELLCLFNSIDIYELIAHIKNNYGITIDKSKIQEIVQTSELYYDKITEKVYIDYDTYFEEI